MRKKPHNAINRDGVSYYRTSLIRLMDSVHIEAKRKRRQKRDEWYKERAQAIATSKANHRAWQDENQKERMVR